MARKRTPGLRKRGRFWHIDRRIRGFGTLRESTGTGELEEAERYLARRLEEIRQASVYGVRPGRTFQEAAEHYVRTSTKRSLGRDVQDLRLVLPYIGDLSLHQVHDATLAAFVAARLADGKAAGTINRTIAVVRRILNLATRVWRDEYGLTWLETTPLLTVQRGPKRQGHILSYEEQGRFLADLRRTFATRLRDGGVPKWTVSACLGHKNGDVTELYALPTFRELRAAVEVLEKNEPAARSST